MRTATSWMYTLGLIQGTSSSQNEPFPMQRMSHPIPRGTNLLEACHDELPAVSKQHRDDDESRCGRPSSEVDRVREAEESHAHKEVHDVENRVQNSCAMRFSALGVPQAVIEAPNSRACQAAAGIVSFM